MAEEKKKGKAPAFQLYPDKALAGTVHLSPPAFKAFWLTCWWMWLHAEDQCSMPDTDAAWQASTLIFDMKQLKRVRSEIMQPHFKLFKKKNRKIVNGGLQKEAAKQKERRQKVTYAANVRWDKNLQRMQMHDTCIANASGKVDVKFLEKYPAYAVLINEPNYINVTPDQYVKCIQSHPQVNQDKAVDQAIELGAMMTNGPDHPALFLKAQFNKIELKTGKGSDRKSTMPRRKGTKKKEGPPF